MSQISDQEEIAPGQEFEKWSQEAIQQRRLDNLRKARETLKKKREIGTQDMKQPFTLTPVTQENISIVPRVDVEAIKPYNVPSFVDMVWDTALGVGSSVVGVMFAVAVPLLVNSIVRVYQESVSTPTTTDHDREKVQPLPHIFNGQSIFMER